AGLSRPVVMMAKEAVNRAEDSHLAEGVRFERRLFHSTFALEDRREGMTAFLEKRRRASPTAELAHDPQPPPRARPEKGPSSASAGRKSSRCISADRRLGPRSIEISQERDP